jgi:ubiquinone/menaquinone biosynthesis C-methylase UbiE
VKEPAMPSIEENRSLWGNAYDWSSGGNEWSAAWGGAHNQWEGTIVPRISRHLPVHTILEIAPGYGRWTAFLARYCERLIAVDLSEKCISACRERFREIAHIECHVNDGRSLPFIRDGSVDFVFSFDSLVHADTDVIESYLTEFARILKPDGAGFIHHSNVAEFQKIAAFHTFLEQHPRIHAVARWSRLLPTVHGRAPRASASHFRESAAAAGIRCVSQEKVNWGGSRLIDCLSTIRNGSSRTNRAVPTWHNTHFMREALCVAERARLYREPVDDA